MRRKAFDIRTRSILVWFSILFFSYYSPLQAEQRAAAGNGTTGPTVILDDSDSSTLSNRVVHQENVGDCACGPCAIFNAFQFGNSALAAELPVDASRLYGKNVLNFMQLLTGKEGELILNFGDELVKGCCMTHDGQVMK